MDLHPFWQWVGNALVAVLSFLGVNTLVRLHRLESTYMPRRNTEEIRKELREDISRLETRMDARFDGIVRRLDDIADRVGSR